MRWRGRDAGLWVERRGVCKKPLGYLDLDQFGSNVLKRQSSSALFVKDEEGRIRTHTHTHTETRMLLELTRFASSLYVIENFLFSQMYQFVTRNIITFLQILLPQDSSLQHHYHILTTINIITIIIVISIAYTALISLSLSVGLFFKINRKLYCTIDNASRLVMLRNEMQ